MIGNPDATQDRRLNSLQPGEAGAKPANQRVFHPKTPDPRIVFAGPPRRCKTRISFARPRKRKRRITQFFPCRRFGRTAECALRDGTIATPVPPALAPRQPELPDRLRGHPCARPLSPPHPPPADRAPVPPRIATTNRADCQSFPSQ